MWVNIAPKAIKKTSTLVVKVDDTVFSQLTKRAHSIIDSFFMGSSVTLTYF